MIKIFETDSLISFIIRFAWIELKSSSSLPLKELSTQQHSWGSKLKSYHVTQIIGLRTEKRAIDRLSVCPYFTIANWILKFFCTTCFMDSSTNYGIINKGNKIRIHVLQGQLSYFQMGYDICITKTCSEKHFSHSHLIQTSCSQLLRKLDENTDWDGNKMRRILTNYVNWFEKSGSQLPLPILSQGWSGGREIQN